MPQVLSDSPLSPACWQYAHSLVIKEAYKREI
jgi:hypothetical protein